MANDGTSRRDVLKGLAFGGLGVALGPVLSHAEGESAPLSRLPRSNPRELGIHADGIARFIEEVNAKVGGLHSMILLRHGKVAAEANWAPFVPTEPHILYSLSKSFTSTAVGLAVSEGHLTVEDRVVSVFPDKLPASVSDHLAAMRVKDLLTMSTGHSKEPSLSSSDWVKDFLAAPVEHQPGTHFLYNTPATHILSAIVQKKTGQRLTQYLGPRLFEPLGIVGMSWDQSPAGVDIGGYGLKVRIEDIAKFGQLYLQKGKWEGRQLLRESWIMEATRRQVSNGNPADDHDWCQGYGYQFWRCRHGYYRGDGAFGQYCIVMQEHDAVLAITSGVTDMGAVLSAAWTHLRPAMSGAGGDEAGLKKLLGTLNAPSPDGDETSTLAERFSGNTYALEPNEDKLKSVRVEFSERRGRITLTSDEGEASFGVSTHEWIAGTDRTGGTSRKMAARGAWAGPNRFTLKTVWLDSPHNLTQTFEFEGDEIRIVDRAYNVGFGPTERPNLKGRK